MKCILSIMGLSEVRWTGQREIVQETIQCFSLVEIVQKGSSYSDEK